MTVPIDRNDLRFWAPAPDPRPPMSLRGETKAHVAIVGGGLSGLSAAYHLSRACPDLDVVVVESHRVGSGASGRNTGILSAGVGGSILDLCRRFGDEEAARLYRASIDAVGYVKDLIGRARICCDLEDACHIKVALTARQADSLWVETETLRRLGFAAEYHDTAALALRVPAPGVSGIAYPESGQLNPALLCRELKRVVQEHGVRVYETSPVSAVTSGATIRIETDGGALVADRAVLATNAHIAQLGVLRGQVIPLQTHVSMTAPLTDAQLAKLAWNGRSSFSEKRHVFDYYRLTSDNRIMFGGGRPTYQAAKGDPWAGRTDIADPAVWSRQHRAFSQTFPSLGEVGLAHQWAGTIGMTRDRLPVVGFLADTAGMVFVAGWNGHGVAMATASGALVTDLLLGGTSSTTSWPWVRKRAPALPPDPLRTMGLSAYLSGMQLLDRLEATFDRLMSRSPRRSSLAERPFSSPTTERSTP